MRGWSGPPASRSGCRPTCLRRSSSSSGAPRSVAWYVGPSTSSSTAERLVGAGGDLLVPVPVHAERRRRRGYDQAELIATAAAQTLRLPISPLLERVRATTAQFDLDRRSRATNVTGAFALRPGGPRGPAPLGGRWIVLVDDVVTTGATLSACAAPLLDAGAVGVSAVTVARER